MENDKLVGEVGIQSEIYMFVKGKLVELMENRGEGETKIIVE